VRLFSTVILTVACAAALSPAQADGWTQFRQIAELNQQPATGANAEVVFVTLQAGTNPSGCSTSNRFYFLVNSDRQKRLFAMLMGAKLSGASVQLFAAAPCHAVTGDAQLDGVVIGN
jgi:hypothetical protein